MIPTVTGVVLAGLVVIYTIVFIVHHNSKKSSKARKKYEDRKRYRSLKEVGLDRLKIDNGELDCMVEVRTVSGSEYIMEESEYLKSVESTCGDLTYFKVGNKWIQKDAVEHTAFYYIGTGTIYTKDFPMGVRVGLLGESKTKIKMIATQSLYDGELWEDDLLIWQNGSWRWGNDWEVPYLVKRLNYSREEEVNE